MKKSKDHADTLLAMLQEKADHVFLLEGGRSRKENEQIREKMKNVPVNESMILFLIDKHEVVWYTKYTKSNREKEPYFEIIYPGGLSIWKRLRMKS